MSTFRKVRLALLVFSGPIGWIILTLLALKNKGAVFGTLSNAVEGTPWEDIADQVQTEIELGLAAVDPEALETIIDAADAAEVVAEVL